MILFELYVKRLRRIMSCFGIFQVCNNTLDRYHADTMLEKYATETIMNLLTFFFNSPFSDSSTTIKVIIN